MSDLYLHIPLETAWRASIIPFSSEVTFYAMQGFGGFNLWPALFMALLGCVIGHSFNWAAGQFLLKTHHRIKLAISDRFYQKYQQIFIRYLLFTLLLAWLPFFNGFVFLAGFFNVRMRTTLILALTGEAAHYLYYILLA